MNITQRLFHFCSGRDDSFLFCSFSGLCSVLGMRLNDHTAVSSLALRRIETILRKEQCSCAFCYDKQSSRSGTWQGIDFRNLLTLYDQCDGRS